MNIDDYCERAKARHSMKSNSELARKLELSHNSPTAWRTRRAWPSDEVMIKLAELAGIDPMEALIDLNIWRSSGEAISIYTSLKKAMHAAMVLAVLIVAGQIATPLKTADAAANLSTGLHAQFILWKILHPSSRLI